MENTSFQLFNAVPFFIQIVFIIVFGVIIFRVVRGIAEWMSNNQQPVETIKAKVISKRENVRRRSSGAGNRGMGMSRTQTTYFVTFELENDDRKEFKVKGNEYGMLAEGDVGHLTFQGTRYHGFERAGNI